LPKTLYAKTAVALTCLFVLTGALFVPWSIHYSRLYAQEVQQSLNRGLARYLVTKNLFLEGGSIRPGAVKESFDTLMGVNPDIELYLLDTHGTITAFSAPPDKVKAERVPMGPIERFLRGDKLPIFGLDPRHPEEDKVFSVAAIPAHGPPEGYLYAVLGGERSASASAMLGRSYAIRAGLLIAGAALVFMLAASLMVFGLITRRLRALSRTVEGFRPGLPGDEAPSVRMPRAGDEVDMLVDAFSEMSMRISSQVERLRHADQLRREFLSNVSHDLRTPLATLQGYLESVLMRGADMPGDERERYLRTALASSRRLGALVGELFELATLDAHDARVSPEPFNLAELVDDVLQKFSLSARNKGLDLRSEHPEDSAFVMADLGLVERALQNLIDNAVKYTPPGGSVTVTVAAPDSEVLVTVSDTGPGIKIEDLPRIFDRFYKVRAEGEAQAGTGLGLSIARRIAELHGGRLDVKSEPGRGAAFTLGLPRWRPGARAGAG